MDSFFPLDRPHGVVINTEEYKGRIIETIAVCNDRKRCVVCIDGIACNLPCAQSCAETYAKNIIDHSEITDKQMESVYQ
jgi:hypothetical protein